MKRLLIISILLLSVGSSQNRVNVNNLVQYGDKYFKENDDKPFNGIVFDLSKETGNKILEFRMVNGWKNGLYKEWSSDGTLINKGKYLNDTQVGDWTEWYDNGKKKIELTYKNGKPEGLYVEWYETGKKKEEFTFKDGEEVRRTLWNYYDNGQKKEEETFIDGKEDGLFTFWYENGQKWIEGTYKDGKREGLYVEWYENGQKKVELTYIRGSRFGSRPNYKKRYPSEIETALVLSTNYASDNNYFGAIENLEKIERQLDELGLKRETLLDCKSKISFQKFIYYAHNQMENEAEKALLENIRLNNEILSSISDTIIHRQTRSTNAFNQSLYYILFGRYDAASKKLEELKKIQEKINDPTAMYNYYGLLGMLALMEGNYHNSIKHFAMSDPYDVYFAYFKALSYRAYGETIKARQYFKEIAETYTDYWKGAIVKRLAQKQLDSF